ncbi:MAG: cyd operon protein YbgE [Sodalis sp. (in: enterobacteria)]|uniref:cyd operon protein YbgE n=1 Tax=Sodalis sp. (in: enterobacteria) TaxID=1898979 RepID=UPI003F353CB0
MTGQAISFWYSLTDKRPLRALSLVMALTLAGCVFWSPSRFAAQTTTLSWWQGILIVWAVCAGVLHGTGFRPRRLRWPLVFLPLPAMLVMIAALLYRFS